MTLQDDFQLCFVEVGLLEQLFDARLVLRPAHAGSNGDDVFSLKNFRWHAFEVDSCGLPHRFFGQPACCQKLHGEPTDEQVLTLDLPALSLKVPVDGRDAGGQTLVGGNEKDGSIIGRERFDVIPTTGIVW